MAEERDTFEGWAILELMGHRRLGGYVSEATIAGSAFVKIDVPSGDNDTDAATQFYSPAAVYCITPTTETMARVAADASHVAPVQEWEPRWARNALERGDIEDAELAEPF